MAGRELRVALLHHQYGSPPGAGAEQLVHALAVALRDAGHEPCVVSSHAAPTRRSMEDGIRVIRCMRLPETLLRRRAVAGPLTHVPLAVRAIASGAYHVAHAFSAPDTVVALTSRRLPGRRAVFTCAETLGRERLADQRLRRWLLGRAVEDSDAVIAPSEESRQALWRWLAAEATVIDPADAAGHERLYRELLSRAN